MREPLGDLYIRLGFANEEEFISALRDVMRRGEEEAARRGTEAGGSFVSGLRSAIIGGLTGGLVAGLFASLQGEISQFVREAIQEFTRLDAALATIRVSGVANVGALANEMRRVADEARVFSTVDISRGVAELIKAGLDANTALEVIRRAANLAASDLDALSGSFGDVALYASQVAQVMRAMGLPIEEVGRVVDVLARAAMDSATDVGSLVAAIADVGPIAAQAGLSIEELAATIAVLTNRGISADQAATGLRSVLSSLVDPPATVREAFNKLGLTLVDATGKTRGFSEVLEALGRVANSGTTGVQLLARGMDTFALATATSLGQASYEIAEFSSRLRNSRGAAEELANSARGTLAGALAEARARAADARAELGERLAPVMVQIYSNIIPAFYRGLGSLIERFSVLSGLVRQSTLDLQAWMRAYGEVRPQDAARLEKLLQEIKQVDGAIRQLESVIEKNQGPARQILEQNLEALKRQRQALQDEILAIQRRAAEMRREEARQAKPPPPPPRPQIPALPTTSTTREVTQADRLAASLREVVNLYRLGRVSGDEYAKTLQRIRQEAEALAAKLPRGDEQRGQLLSIAAQAAQAYQALQEARRKAQEEAARERQRAIEEAAKLAGELTPSERSRRIVEESWREYIEAIQGVLDEYARGIEQVRTRQLLFGDTIDVVTEELRVVEAAINGLIRLGLDPQDEALARLVERWRELKRAQEQAASAERFREVLRQANEAIAGIEEAVRQAIILGQDPIRAEYEATTRAIRRLIDLGYTSEDAALQALIARREELARALEEEARAREELEEAARRAARLTEEERSRRAVAGAFHEARPSPVEVVSGDEVRRVLERVEEVERAVAARRAIAELLGEPLDEAALLEERLNAIQNALVQLVLIGLDPTDAAFQELVARAREASAQLAELNEVIQAAREAGAMTLEEKSRRASMAAFREQGERIASILQDVERATQEAAIRQALLGDEFDANTYLANRYTEALVQLILAGLDPASEEAERLRQRIQELRAEIERGQQERERARVVEAVSEDLQSSALRWGEMLAQGILSGDMGDAFRRVISDATNIFTSLMVRAILGPIAEALGQVVATHVAALMAGEMSALGPLGLILGGLFLIGGLLSGLGSQQAGGTGPEPPGRTGASIAERMRSQAPSITYHAETTVNVALEGSLNDPTTRAQIRQIAEEVTIATLRRLRLIT